MGRGDKETRGGPVPGSLGGWGAELDTGQARWSREAKGGRLLGALWRLGSVMGGASSSHSTMIWSSPTFSIV